MVLGINGNAIVSTPRNQVANIRLNVAYCSNFVVSVNRVKQETLELMQ